MSTQRMVGSIIVFGVAALSWVWLLGRSAGDTPSPLRLWDAPATAFEAPIGPLEGLGPAGRTVSTENAEAQELYDQGLAALHSYRWRDAARSFHEALRRDPTLAMAHVELARVALQIRDQAGAREHLQKAAAAATQLPALEQGLIRAMELQIDAAEAGGNAGEALLDTYRTHLDVVLKDHPGDAETWILRGLAEESSALGRGQGGKESSLRFYLKAIEIERDHPGANHYLAHSLENVGRYEEALRHAETFARVAPSSPHAQHMVAHVLPRLGRWNEAVEWFEKTDQMETAVAKAAGDAPGDDWHHVHNLGLWGLALAELGRDAQARAVLERGFRSANPSATMQLWWSLYPEYLITSGDSDAGLAAAEELAGRPSPVAKVIGTALMGEAHLATGRPYEATVALNDAERAFADLADVADGVPLIGSLVQLAEEYVILLQARVMFSQGKASEGQILEMAHAIGGLSSFDAWGRQHLRLRRFQFDARALGHESTAEQIAAIEGKLRGQGPARGMTTAPARAPAAPAATTAADVASDAVMPAKARNEHDWNDANIAWSPVDAGLARARAEGLPVCLIFYTDWCPHCANYARVFHDPDVVAESKHFVMIRVDRDAEPGLSARFAPDGEYIPRTYFLNPEGEIREDIDAGRDPYRYFFDERRPAHVLGAMKKARS